jgi:hypothetical protein
MKVFVSYSTTDKAIAGDLFRQMGAYGVDAFLAHETVEIAADWKGRILRELAAADAMIVLLSINCQRSKWTGHEVGYFYAHTRHQGLIIPISLDETISYGMFDHLQSERIPMGVRSIPVVMWLAPLFNAFPGRMIPILVEKLVDCRCFRTSEVYMKLLQPHYLSIDQAQLDQLMMAVTSNPCVYSARECRMTYIPRLIANNTNRLSPAQIEGMQHKLDSDEQFIERVILPTSAMVGDGHGK